MAKKWSNMIPSPQIENKSGAIILKCCNLSVSATEMTLITVTKVIEYQSVYQQRLNIEMKKHVKPCV